MSYSSSKSAAIIPGLSDNVKSTVTVSPALAALVSTVSSKPFAQQICAMNKNIKIIEIAFFINSLHMFFIDYIIALIIIKG